MRLVILVVVCVVVVGGEESEGDCVASPRDLRHWVHHMKKTALGIESFPLWPPNPQLTFALDRLKKNGSLVSGRHPLFGAKNCEDNTNSIPSNVSTKRRRVCPLKWQLNFDHLRLPQSILESRCACTESAGSYECETVYLKMAVLRSPEDCSGFRPKIEWVAMGCNAVYPRVHEMDASMVTMNEGPVMESKK